MIERPARERHPPVTLGGRSVRRPDLAQLHAHRGRKARVELAVRGVRGAAARALERALRGAREAGAAVRLAPLAERSMWFASATASGKIQRARGMPSARAVASEQNTSPAA